MTRQVDGSAVYSISKMLDLLLDLHTVLSYCSAVSVYMASHEVARTSDILQTQFERLSGDHTPATEIFSSFFCSGASILKTTGLSGQVKNN